MKLSIDLLRERNFLLYWVAAIISSLGDAIFVIALNWIIVDATGSGAMLGLVMMSMALAQILLSMFGGVYVDRADPRKVMVAGNIVRVVLMVFLLLVGWKGTPPVASLFVAGIGLGAVDAFYWPAYAAFRQRIVRKEQYVQSNSLLMVPAQAAAIVGPLFGGALVAGHHTQFVILLNGISFVVALICLNFVRLRDKEMLASAQETATTGQEAQETATTGQEAPEIETATQKNSMKADLLDGVRFVLSSPLLIATSLSAFVVNLCVNGVMIGLPFLAQSYGKGALGFGQLNMGLGIGGAAGALLFSVLAIQKPTPRKTLLACLLEGVLFLLLGVNGSFLLTVVLLSLVGIAETAINIIAPSVNQTIIPQEIMGRVIGFMILLMSGSEPLAKAIGGVLLDHVSAPALFSYGGALEVLTAAVFFFLPAIRRYERN